MSSALQTPCQQASTSATCPNKIRCTEGNVDVKKFLTL